MYVCTHHMHACIHICIQTNKPTYTHKHIFACNHEHTHTSIHIHTYIHAHIYFLFKLFVSKHLIPAYKFNVVSFKVDEQHYGQRLCDIRQGLHDLFDNVLDQARGDLAGNDLGLAVLQHDALNNPIVVPLRPWDELNAYMEMETIEMVVNSHESLSIDDSFNMTVSPLIFQRVERDFGSQNSNGKSSCEMKRSNVTLGTPAHHSLFN